MRETNIVKIPIAHLTTSYLMATAEWRFVDTVISKNETGGNVSNVRLE